MVCKDIPGKRAISISPLHSLVQQLLSVVAALPPSVQQTHKSQLFLHKVIYIKGYVVNKLHAEQPEYAARERQGRYLHIMAKISHQTDQC